MYALYSVLLALAALLTSPVWLYRALREKKYLGNFRQRLGWKLKAPANLQRPLWIHAVSVGEVMAARPLIRALRINRPEIPLIISTVTLTGQALAQKTLSNDATVIYFPFDFSFSIKKYLRRLRPRAVALLETELWPNFLRLCRLRHIPVLLINGRISDKSFGHYEMIKCITERMLANVDFLGAQSEEDRRRLLHLGAAVERVHVTGNLKFDLAGVDGQLLPPWLESVRTALELTPDAPMIVVGSSMKGEEPLYLEAYRRIRQRIPEAKLILAPRHPERFDEVASLISSMSLPFTRRTAVNLGKRSNASIMLLDTIGELRAIYTLASVAVIGGSFLPFGGHNPLEPAACCKPIVFGPHMSNFRDMAAMFLREKAARQASPETLATILTDLLMDNQTRIALGQRAIAAVRANQGATARTLNLILPYLH